jgi:hypothetical protein
MQPEPPEQKKNQQWVMACLGVSVVLGIVVGQFVDFEDFGKLHLVSLTGRGPLGDLVLIAAAILLVLGSARLTITLHPAGLMCVGVLILLGPFVGPAVFARASSNREISIPFVPLAVLEFVGAALLGAGLQRIISPAGSRDHSGKEGNKPE